MLDALKEERQHARDEINRLSYDIEVLEEQLLIEAENIEEL